SRAGRQERRSGVDGTLVASRPEGADGGGGVCGHAPYDYATGLSTGHQQRLGAQLLHAGAVAVFGDQVHAGVAQERPQDLGGSFTELVVEGEKRQTTASACRGVSHEAGEGIALTRPEREAPVAVVVVELCLRRVAGRDQQYSRTLGEPRDGLTGGRGRAADQSVRAFGD